MDVATDWLLVKGKARKPKLGHQKLNIHSLQNLFNPELSPASPTESLSLVKKEWHRLNKASLIVAVSIISTF